MWVEKEKAQERYNICKSCECFFHPTKICLECNCFMPFKVKLDKISCPKEKW
jgi:hypothetical protein